jgi:hypothetical protein
MGAHMALITTNIQHTRLNLTPCFNISPYSSSAYHRLRALVEWWFQGLIVILYAEKTPLHERKAFSPGKLQAAIPIRSPST